MVGSPVNNQQTKQVAIWANSTYVVNSHVYIIVQNQRICVKYCHQQLHTYEI